MTIRVSVLRSILSLGAACLLPAAVSAQRSEPVPPSGSPARIVCAPRIATTEHIPSLTIVGSQDGTVRTYFGPSDTLVINGGRSDGVDVGQEYFVRRVVSPTLSADSPAGVLHTAGWLRIIATERETSLAAVAGVCDRLQRGDFLESLYWPGTVAVRDPGTPDYDNSGTIVLGLDGRSLIAEHDYVAVDLGSVDGILPGQRFTIFRHTLDGRRAVTELGEAVAVSVDEDWTTAHVGRLQDIVEVGDLVAPQREP